MVILTKLPARRALPVRALFALLALANLLFVPSCADAAAVVTLSAQPERVAVGETIALSVSIADIENLYGVELHLRFDAQRLQVLPNAEGKAATPGGVMSHDFVALNGFDNTVGSVDYAAVQVNPHTPASGSGPLITIRLKAVAPANAPVNFASVILSDSNGVPLVATTANAVIAVLGEGATPPPATPAPGITALAPPASVPAEVTATPRSTSVSPSPAAEATRTQSAGVTVAPALAPAQSAATAASAPVAAPAATSAAAAPPTATSTAASAPIAASANSAGQASSEVRATAAPAPIVAQVANAVVAQPAQPPALSQPPTRVEVARETRETTKNTFLLIPAAALLLAGAVLFVWRRRALR